MCCILATANPVDSLVKFYDLEFKWDVEKTAFIAYASNTKSNDVTNLFLKPYMDSEGYDPVKVNQRINECVSDLQKTTAGENELKQVKTIYKEVHKRFFKVYKLQNSFSDIFERGEYNCVSGSAMYAMVFQKMGIPYQILEAPQHVFLMAYPNSHKVFIETTSPQNGYLKFNEAYMERFINYMVKTKLISQDELTNSTAAELFNKYYFDKNGMNIIQLAAIQYANYAVYFLENNDYRQALPNIQKAYYLSPNERHKYVLRTVLEYLVSNNNYKDIKNVNYLKGLCAFNNTDKNEISNEKIGFEFGRLLKEQLIEDSNYDNFARSYEILNTTLTDSALKKEIGFIYHYELARLGYIQYKDKEYEVKHLKSAYEFNPKDMDLQNLVLAYFGRLAETSNDAAIIMKLGNEFTGNFGFLNEHAAYNSTRSNCMLELCYQSYMLGEINKGDKLLTEFETLCDSNKDIKPMERYVEKAYSTVATYYYKKGNMGKTKQTLKKGLQYAPDSFGLKMRLSQLH